jgi:PAS domain S-box-containing protein
MARRPGKRRPTQEVHLKLSPPEPNSAIDLSGARKSAIGGVAQSGLSLALVGEKGLLRHFDDPVVIVDEAWRVVYMNSAAGQFFSQAPSESLGKELWALWPESVRREVEKQHRRSLAEGIAAEFQATPTSAVCGWLRIRAFECESGIAVHYRDITAQRQLSELQSHLAVVVDSADDAIISEDLQGNILSWNRGAERLFGYTAAELIGKNISMLAMPDRADEIPKILALIANGEHLDHFETQRRAKDGSVRTVSLTVSPLRDAAGTVIGAYKIARDISDRRKVSELQERLSAIVDSSDDAVLSKDLDGIIRSWNRGAAKLFGYSAEEVVGQHISKLAAPEVVDEIPAILARLQRGEIVDHYETKRMTKDGRILTVSLTVSPIRDAAGKVVGASKVARDISGQRKVLELQEHLAAIVASSDDAIISKDLNGFILSWNRGAEKLFGYTPDEIIGKHISVLAPPEVADEIPNILARLQRGEFIDHYETKRKTKDGRILTVSLTVSPIRDAAGNVIGASKVARDITERGRQEQQLREANAALIRSNEDLQQFAYSASHDLQEPLRMVSIYSELLKKKFGGKLGPVGQEYLDFATTGATRMEQLLKALRAYTFASTAELEPAGVIDATESLAKAMEDLKAAIKDSGAIINQTPLPRVRILAFQLEQVFQNLIGNAIRYRRVSPPTIDIGAHRKGRDWVFSVQDNGIGIDPRYKEQVFGIFKRLQNSPEQGTGMGLAISERVIRRAGGRIWVESEPGQGSTFFFTLPCPE